MTIRPFVRRDLRVMSRRGETYVNRAGSAATVLVVLAACDLLWRWMGWERATASGLADFTRAAFALVVSVQALGTWGMVAVSVAPRIAGERDRKTLDALLASRFSNAEVVLGMAASGLVKHASSLAAVLPIVLLMVPLGGLDPRLVALAYGGLATTTFALAGISSAVSIVSRVPRSASAWALLVALTWLYLPLLAVTVLPRIWPWGSSWIVPIMLPILDSSPLGVLANFVGAIRRCSPVESIGRMMAYQLAGGAALFLLAIAGLRPAARALYDGEGRKGLLLRRRRRAKRWPPCGDDPVFWRERHTSFGMSRLEQALGLAVSGAGVVPLLLAVEWFAVPAFRELWAMGYGATSGRFEVPEVNPIAQAFVRGRSGGPPPGLARIEFNSVLRQITLLWGLIYALVLAGTAAEGIARERTRDTWPGLLATPLTGPEIVRAKMLGAVWRFRPLALLMVASWALGLLSGAVHPIGFMAALALLGASTWFLVALGTYHSLRSRDAEQATSRALRPACLLVFSGLLAVFLPTQYATVLLGTACLPLQAALSLVTYDEVAVALRTGAFPELEALRIGTGEGAARVLAAYLAGLVVHLVAAALYTRAACRGFDAAVGRPVKGGGSGLSQTSGLPVRV